jgi:hypothetical protein
VEAMERSRTVRLSDSYLSLGYATGARRCQLPAVDQARGGNNHTILSPSKIVNSGLHVAHVLIIHIRI